MHFTRFPPTYRLTLLIFLLAAAGCGSSVAARGQAASSGAPAIEADIASSDLAVGLNRFTFGLIAGNRPLQGGAASVAFYARRGNGAILKSRSSARFNYFSRDLKDSAANRAAIELGGVFVTYARFDHPGEWGAEIRYRYHGAVRAIRAGFKVNWRSSSPAVGAPAPRSDNPTVFQVPAARLDSGRPPDDMHRLSIRQAIAQRKPLVVLFATAAYCTSRLCGPEIQVVQQLERQYRRSVSFIHIEVYKNANPDDGYAPTFLQWGLQSEPWVFVVDRRGIVTAKFEGPTPTSEIRPALARALA